MALDPGGVPKSEPSWADGLRGMSAWELRDAGILLEVNRQIFHPMGLALAFDGDDPGRLYVVDGRDDPEGIIFDGWTDEDAEKIGHFDRQFERNRAVREAEFGWHVQPRPGDGE